MKSPSKKQIELVDKIAEKLHIDFPRGDFDFTAQKYYIFISKHIKQYNEINKPNYIPLFEDDNDIFWGYDYGLWEF